MRKKRIIGLTGGIACGKSTVAAYLRERGFVVLDADAVSRRLTAPRGAALPEIRAAFGDFVFQDDGSLDRKKLGALVFSEEGARARLNALLHPLIMQTLREECEAAEVDIVFQDIPLLYEIGAEKDMDSVWAVYCAPETQLSRLMARDGLSREEALARIASQWSAEEKASRADAAIDTTEGWEKARKQVDGLLQTLMERGESSFGDTQGEKK